MAMNPRIEEVSDSDSDPSEMDPSDFAPSSSLINPANIPASQNDAAASRQSQAASMAAHREKTKHYQCLYPLYFDKNRSKSQGRRVPSSLAVANPLARAIIDALQSPSIMIPGSQIVFEPGKLHPKDWSNPGRVRILLREEGRDRTNGRVKNKEDLIRKVGQFLVDHPTTEADPLKLQIRGLPPPKDGEIPKVAVPRGWKLSSILPLHSPALSGGGVDEDMMKEMIKGMQGGAGGNPLAGMADMLGGMGGMGGLGGMGGMGGLGGMGGAGGSPGGQRKVKAAKKGK